MCNGIEPSVVESQNYICRQPKMNDASHQRKAYICDFTLEVDHG